MARKRSRAEGTVKKTRQTPKPQPKTRPKKAVKTCTEANEFQQMSGAESTYFKKA